ncbi:MAG: hypothetical protein ACKVWV_17310 [Planctomycetota bacterium]
MLILSLALTFFAGGAGCAQPAPRSTPPPGPETEETRASLDEARRQLAARADAVSDVLCSARFMPIHDRTEFRELVRDHAPASRITMASGDEPGERMVVFGEVREKDGTPAKNALVYLYHTSAKGWYSDKAAHISGNSGDTKHARLFGYVRTNGDGRFEVRTIRPAGYPETDLPAHIHFTIHVDRDRSLGGEIQFDDDPRLTPEWRARSKHEGTTIVPVERVKGGEQVVRATFTLR